MGYRFGTGKQLQAQPKVIANSRLQTNFEVGASGEIQVAITTGSAATQQDVENRRLSARENSGIRNRDVEQLGDYLLLPESKRDLFLSGTHGITSQCPVILLTSPRSSEKIDISSDLTTTPFIIDLNKEIKKSIESNITSTISRYASALGLSNAEYTQKLGDARQYADLCLTAARSKDRIVSLTNVINVENAGGPNQSQNIVIDAENYQFLKGLPDVLTFFKSIDDAFTMDTFTLGSSDSVNTKSLAQVFKTLYNQFLLGSFEIPSQQDDAESSTGILKGSVKKEINDLVVNLQDVERERDTFANVIGDHPGELSFSFDGFENPDNLTDLVRIVQRDLIVQGAESQLNALAGNSTSGFEALGKLIGTYKDQNSTSNTIFKQGFLTVDDFVEGSTLRNNAQELLVKSTDESNSFNTLDYVGGHDYLLYDELSSEVNNITLNNLTTFANEYSQFALKLRLFYQAIYSDDAARQTTLSIIVSNFLSFFTTSQITRTEFTSKASAARMGVLLAASTDDYIAARLFEILCAQDRGRDYEDDLDSLKGMINGESSSPGTVEVSSTISTGGEDWFRLSDDYLVGGPGTSFGMFHTIARQVDAALANDNLSAGSQKFTTYSLKLSVNARAFVFYQLFLSILRNFTFRVQSKSNFYREIKITYQPDQYKSIIFALQNYDKSISDFSSVLADANFVQSSTADAAAVESANYKYKLDAKNFYLKYFYETRRKINEQEQNCLDLVNLLVNHSSQILQAAATLNSSVASIKRIATESNLSNKESTLNAIQLEQASLKRNLVDRYTNLLLGASYLPSAIDYNIGQANNTKKVVATYPVLADAADETVTRKFFVAVGLPAGMIESLRYQNTSIIGAHLYAVDLVFRNLQISQRQQQENETNTGRAMPGTEGEADPESSGATRGYVLKTFTFSTRAFIDEGSLTIEGPDTRSSELSSYEQIFGATKFKVLTDEGNYISLTSTDLRRIMSDDVVNNHIVSHYGKLFLRSTAGIVVDEEAFDLVPQQRIYPDPDKLPNYTTVADDISANFATSDKNQLNKERSLRDLSRAIYFAPQQHKTSAMISKTFERIHVIPIDISDILNDPAIGISGNDVAFIDVVSRIRLAESQPPVTLAPTSTRRAYASALGESGVGSDLIRQIDVESQSAGNVGINNMIETANRYGGRLGGYRR